MASVQVDARSEARKRLDERIACEPQLPVPELPPDALAQSVELHFPKTGQYPVAVMGIVENGLVRPLDPQIKLPEHARVIIVTSRAV